MNFSGSIIKARMPARAPGSTLVASLLITGILMVSLAGYLRLIVFQTGLSSRSESWNMAIPVAEAGLEEGFAQLFLNQFTNYNANGWAMTSDGFRKVRAFSDDLYYSTSVRTSIPPAITSSGYVRLAGQTNYVDRTVQVVLQRLGMFNKALLTRQIITVVGNNVNVDSFDSSLGPYSIANRHDRGDLGCISRMVGCVSIGNGKIFGRVTTGPGGSVDSGPSGSVGDLQWHLDNQTGIEPDWFRDDLNIAIPDVQVPPIVGTAPTSGSVNGTNFMYLLGPTNIATTRSTTTNYYVMDSLVMGGNHVLAVTGNAVLRVDSGISITGNAYIQIFTNATLIIYMNGSSASLGGNGVMNPSSQAATFQYFGSPNNTSLSINGNGAFTGVVYAPQAELNLDGGGKSDTNFIGSCVSGTAKLNGNFSFHYDEQLDNLYQNGWAVTSWNEL